MPPKSSSVNHRKGAQKQRNDPKRADSLSDSDSDDLPPSQKDGRSRLALLVIGPNNNLVKLFQDTSSSSSKEPKIMLETPVKKNQKGSRANKKTQFSPMNASATPKSHQDEVMDRALNQLDQSPLDPMKYLENETKSKLTKGRKKNVSNKAQPVSTKTSFSPDSKPLNGKTSTKSSLKLPTNTKAEITSKSNLNPEGTATVKRGRGRPKGSVNKPKGSEPIKARGRSVNESPQKIKRARILSLKGSFFEDDGDEDSFKTAEPLHEDITHNNHSPEAERPITQDLERSDENPLNKSLSTSSQNPFASPESKSGKGRQKAKDTRLKIERSLESAILFQSSSDGSTSRRARRAAVNRNPTSETKPKVVNRSKVVKRKSYPDRGKRLLSASNKAEPNPNVEEGEYNRYLDNNLSDAENMRQLLIWCFRKNLEQEYTEEDPKKKDILSVAKLIETEVLQDLIDGKVSVDWTDPNDDELIDTPMEGLRIMKPNATNEANKESIEVFKQKLKQLKIEDAQWQRAYKNALRPLESLTIDADNVNPRELQAYLRKKDASGEFLKNVVGGGIENKLQLSLEAARKSVKEDLPANTDKLFHLLHKLKQSITLTSKLDEDRLTSRVTKLARNFGNRKVLGPAVKDVSERDLLRGISRIDTSSKVH